MTAMSIDTIEPEPVDRPDAARSAAKRRAIVRTVLEIGTPLVAPLIGLNNPKTAMAYGGLMGTTSGVAGGLAATAYRASRAVRPTRVRFR